MAYYRQILLVKEQWESDAEEKARYIINNHIEGKEIGVFCICGCTILSKEQVKDNKKTKFRCKDGRGYIPLRNI